MNGGGQYFIRRVNTFNITINAVAPSISSVNVPANATYIVGQNLDFTVNFSETVTVNTGGGTPYIQITLDTGGTVNAGYLSGTGTCPEQLLPPIRRPYLNIYFATGQLRRPVAKG